MLGCDTHLLAVVHCCRSRFSEGMDCKNVSVAILANSPAVNFASVKLNTMKTRMSAAGLPDDEGIVQRVQDGFGGAIEFGTWALQNDSFAVTQAAGRVLRGPSGPRAYHAGLLVYVGQGWAQLFNSGLLPARFTKDREDVAIGRLQEVVQVCAVH